MEYRNRGLPIGNAGMETTGNTMAWALYNISMRPQILAGVEAELDSLGLLRTPERPVCRPVEYDDLNKLVYLNACIKVSKGEASHMPCYESAWSAKR